VVPASLPDANRLVQAHPFSSRLPNGKYPAFTIKELGDYTRTLAQIPIGTPVFVEGPYGALTGAARTKARVLLIAGGIGITPLRALLEELPACEAPDFWSPRERPDELVFKREIDELASLPVPPSITSSVAAGHARCPAIRSIPGLCAGSCASSRTSYVCGQRDDTRVLSGLRWLRFRNEQVHYERFAF